MAHRHQDTLQVTRDDEDGEITVHNALNVTMAHQVRGGNPTHETYPGSSRIEEYGGGREPDFVTAWVAEELWHEHNIDLFGGHDEFDIEVVDIDDAD